MRRLVTLAVVILVAACGAPRADSVTLTVFAAASLTDAVDALAAAYRDVASHIEIRASFDASSTLRVQIEQGAPADLFLSADERQPAALAGAGHASVPVRFARNTLAIVSPAVRGRVRDPFDLAAPGVRVIAAGAEVPIARYADELVSRLGALPDAPPGFAAAYRANIVSREDNVRAVLAKVELREGDAGIVYDTDVRGADVATVAIPPEVSVAAVYAGAVVAASPRRDEAARFLAWIAGDDGQAVLARLGFSRP